MAAEGRPDGEIVVPASIANLGGGLDTLAVAVRLYLRVRIVDVRHDGGARLTVVRSRPVVPGDNAVERAFAHLARRGRTPSVRVEAESEIPIGAGLGSSAAAIVAGLRVFERVDDSAPDTDLLHAAAAIEGHADNVAAALMGGLVSVSRREDGGWDARPWSWPSELRIVVATPSRALRTSASRQALPAAIPRADAVSNLQRVVLLLHALGARDFDALREAVADAWHQPARATLVPELSRALALRDPDLLGVFLSGAGPSIAALATSGAPRAARLLAGVYDDPALVAVRELEVHQALYRSNDSRRAASLSLIT